MSASLQRVLSTTSILHLLPTGEGEIIKKTKYGIWILIDSNKIFIHFSDTFIDPDLLLPNISETICNNL